MKDTAIKMYKMKKYFINNHKIKHICKCPKIYGNIQIALLKRRKNVFNVQYCQFHGGKLV